MVEYPAEYPANSGYPVNSLSGATLIYTILKWNGHMLQTWRGPWYPTQCAGTHLSGGHAPSGRTGLPTIGWIQGWIKDMIWIEIKRSESANSYRSFIQQSIEQQLTAFWIAPTRYIFLPRGADLLATLAFVCWRWRTRSWSRWPTWLTRRWAAASCDAVPKPQTGLSLAQRNGLNSMKRRQFWQV